MERRCGAVGLVGGLEPDEDSDGSEDEGDRDVVEGLQLSEATVRLLMA